MFDSEIRKFFFHLNDALHGRQIGKHLNELDYFYKQDPKQRRTIQSQKLNIILKHATKSVDFYSHLENYSGLRDFPVIDKNIIRQNYDRFISRQFKKSDLIKTITSGSTGTPFVVYQNRDKKNRNSADTIYFAQNAGYNLGEKLFYFKIWSELNKKSRLIQIAQNIVPIDVFRLDDLTIEHIIATIKNEKSKIHFLGYSSALETIVRYLEKKKFASPIQEVGSIITMSESVSSDVKEVLSKYFCTKVVSRYSNIENGIIAQQCLAENNEFHINEASYFIEVLDMKNDLPVESGQSGRIVITDLYNFGMPLIRYDTGDVGSILSASNCASQGSVFNHIEGRKLDQIFNPDGVLISSYIVYKNMWKYTELNQYQFMQINEREYCIVINPSYDFNRENELIGDFQTLLGNDAVITVKYVDEIPLLSSGKRKKVVNLMLNKL
ncbi:MAG: CoF synthetase [Bacteroidia bacterium]|nr:CoF synthetase [Bacteroidia bacterium]